ncbi:lipopolysaccharide biosynthesis protein [Phenylobacterium sp.]|jgi:O-antigen/teichoic acid export membrane protein|uniref:lipopolysaccharide biosynthesis protein n=1 Tax=Phenylobacterium sp. TaxID=1871053 RepID=UPI002F3F4B1F
MTTDAAMQIAHRSGMSRVLANTGVLLGGRTANAVVSLAYMAAAARLLGVAEVGVLILINAFAQLVGEVVKFNSWQAVLHYGAPALAEGRRDRLQQVVRFAVFLDVVSGLASVAVAIAAAHLFGQRLGWGAAENPAAALYCLSIVFLVPASPIGLLRLFDRFDLIAAQAPISSAVRLAGSGLALVTAPTLGLFLTVWAVGSGTAFLYLAAASLAELKRRNLLEGFRWRGPLTAGMPGAWRFAWATNVSGSLDTAFTHAITLVVGAVAGPSPAALWRVGRQVADALAKPAQLLAPALYPELARLHVTQGEHAMRRLARQVGLLGGGIGTLLLLISATAGRPLLTLVMGQGFAGAARVMTWQVGAAVIGIWSIPLEPMLVSLGRPGDAVKVRLIVSAVLLVCLVPVVQRFGLTGAGAALVMATASLAVGMFAMLQLKAGAAPAPTRTK